MLQNKTRKSSEAAILDKLCLHLKTSIWNSEKFVTRMDLHLIVWEYKHEIEDHGVWMDLITYNLNAYESKCQVNTAQVVVNNASTQGAADSSTNIKNLSDAKCDLTVGNFAMLPMRARRFLKELLEGSGDNGQQKKELGWTVHGGVLSKLHKRGPLCKGLQAQPRNQRPAVKQWGRELLVEWYGDEESTVIGMGTMTNTRSGMTPAAIEEMVNQRVDASTKPRWVNRDLRLGNGK
ncbi:hypothetical protein Tco_0956654 [Tanacetum coccineum]